MKQTIRLMMVLVLLLAATGAKADSYKGTLERHGSKMEYAFSGCTVTAKHKPVVELGNTFVVIVDGQITAGTTLQATCKRLKGKRSKYDLIVSWVLYYANGQTKAFKKSAANGDSPSLNLTIPEDVVKVDVDLKYEEKEWNGKSGEKLSCRMELSVSKKNGVRPTEIYHNLDVVKIGGTIDGRTGQMVPGSQEILAEVDYTLTVRNLHDTMFGKTSDYINGEKVTATCNVKLKGEASYTITLRNGVDNKIIKETKNAPLEATFPVVCHKDGIGIVVGFKYKDKKTNREYSTSSHMGIQTNLVEGSDVPATTTTNNFNWNDVAPDERCSHCHGQWADYRLHRGVNQYQETYGDAAKRCMSNVGNKPEKDMLEYFFGWLANNDRYSTGNPNDINWTEFSSSERTGLYDMNIYFNDVIATKRNSRLVLDGVDGEKVLTFEPGTLAHLVKRNADGSHRWKIYRGRVIGKFFRHVGKEPVFETSTCQAKPTGTLFVLEDDGTTSQIYLLSGSMDVASKKTNKKVRLKPGQAATVTKDGQTKIQKFDIKKAAQKYGITTAELQGITTTTGTTGLVFTADKLHYKILSDKTVEVTGEVRGTYSGHVKIPAKVKHKDKEYQVVGIGKQAFANQTKMTGISIPTSIRGIAEDAFLNSGLTQVVIPGDEVSIVKNAFRNCKKLTVALCSGKKPQCSPDAFNGCTAMKELRIKGISESNNGKKLNGTNAVIKVIK